MVKGRVGVYVCGSAGGENYGWIESYVYVATKVGEGISQGVIIKSNTEQDTAIYTKDFPKTRFNIYKVKLKDK